MVLKKLNLNFYVIRKHIIHISNVRGWFPHSSICPPFLWRQTCILFRIHDTSLLSKSWVQIAFPKWLNVLLQISKPLLLADILVFWTSFLRRLMFSCVRSVLLQPERSLFWFKLDISVLSFKTFFQIVILIGETLSRRRCSKSCWTSLKLLVFNSFVTTKIRCSLLSCILEVLKNEWINSWRTRLIYILMVSRLLNNIRPTFIAFHVNYVETAFLSKDCICFRKHAFDTFHIIYCRIYNFRCNPINVQHRRKNLVFIIHISLLVYEL